MTRLKSVSVRFQEQQVEGKAALLMPGGVLSGWLDVEIAETLHHHDHHDADQQKETHHIEDVSVNYHHHQGSPSTAASMSLATTTSATTAANAGDSVTIRLEGYGKTQWRAAGDYHFGIRDAFTNQRRSIPIPHDVEPGSKHSFPFDFELPEELPPSFEGKHGFIRYRLRVKAKHVNDVVVPVKIVFVEEVNDDDELLTPFEDQRRRNIQMFCVSWGSRTVHAKVDRAVYHYQGDVALISARFSNECGKSARPVAKLVQQQTFYGKGLMTKAIKKSVCQWFLAPCANLSPMVPNEERLWTNAECTLPAVVPSFHSSVIDVDYFIEVELVDMPTSKLVPVKLGQKPIASIRILMADGPFQRKPVEPLPVVVDAMKQSPSNKVITMNVPSPAQITLVENASRSSFISDVSELMTPTNSNLETLGSSSSYQQQSSDDDDGPMLSTKMLTPGKDLPYIREDSHEAETR